MPYEGLQDGLYFMQQQSAKKGVVHYGILDIGNRLSLSQAERRNPTVIHQTPPALRVDRLRETGSWNVLGRITDETRAVRRIRASLQAPVYHLLSNNCEQFARFVATGKKESRQLQAVAVVFGLLIVGFLVSR